MFEKVILFVLFMHLPPVSKVFRVCFERVVFLIIFDVEIDLGTIRLSKYLKVFVKIISANFLKSRLLLFFF